MFPEDTNTRAKDMWQAISQDVDFRQKNVVDLGCGHGEMLWRTLIAGADRVCGIDIELKPYARQLAVIYTSISLIKTDLSADIQQGEPYWLRENRWDIALCFSVLPYLEDHRKALEWMARSFPVCVIEVQYVPEPYNIDVSDDKEMFTLLRKSGFDIVYRLGSTHVNIRDAERTIWKCENEQ